MSGRKQIKTGLIVLFGISVLFGFIEGVRIYRYMYRGNVVLKEKFQYVYIPTGSTYHDVKTIFENNKFLRNTGSFEWVAHRKHYESKVRPGRYKIRNGMSNTELVNLLRAGIQEPVKVQFQNIRTTEELAGKISGQIEADSISLIKLLRNSTYLDQFGVNPTTSFILFIPNTYEFFWNTSAEKFLERMYKEKKKFWNDDRLKQCRTIGLDICRVVILASIVEKETARDIEKPYIAGVYMNRLHKGWPLQADPTLLFAWNDYSIKRVYNKHKEINSEYNTYKKTGLPPGPICLPSIASINAVLHYKKHDFMFFCAKADLSGFHAFAVTLEEHNRNAKRYQSALSRLKIH
jgi:UPF0755 protein